MTLTVTTLQSTDIGAPTLTGELGSAITFFDATLLPLGWTKEFTGTNVAAYRNSVSDGGSGCYVRINDNAPDSNGARAFSIQVFSEMTDIDTGSNATGTVFFRKSSTLDDTARPWVMVADGLTFYLTCPLRGDSSSLYRGSSICGAGDYKQDQGSPGMNYFCFGHSNGSTSSKAQWAAVTVLWSTAAEDVAFYAMSPYTSGAESRAICSTLPGAVNNPSEGNLCSDISPVVTDEFFVPARIIIYPNVVPGLLRGAYLSAQRMRTGTPDSGTFWDGTTLRQFITNITGQDSSSSDGVADGAGGIVVDTVGPW
jgi:hypothetical protein